MDKRKNQLFLTGGMLRFCGKSALGVLRVEAGMGAKQPLLNVF